MKTAEFLKKIQFWIFIILSGYFSLAPHPSGILERTSDKIIHAAGYFMLFISCDIAYRTIKRLPTRIILLFSFSLLMEILQHFIPNRHFSFLDLLANLAGLCAAYLILSITAKISGP